MSDLLQIDFSAVQRAAIVGIDLGTTNSLVAFMDLTGPEIIPGEDGDRLVPSVVSLTRVGRDRRRQRRARAAHHPARAHRLFGEAADGPRRRPTCRTNCGCSRSASPKAASPSSGWNSASGPSRRPKSPPSSCASSSRTRKRYLGEAVPQAVITVPAYFNDAQRQATQGRRTHRGPGSAAAGERTHRGGAGLRPGQAQGQAWSPSTTWAAAPSTSPSCDCTTASSKCWPPTATPTWAATISTTCCCASRSKTSQSEWGEDLSGDGEAVQTAAPRRDRGQGAALLRPGHQHRAGVPRQEVPARDHPRALREADPGHRRPHARALPQLHPRRRRHASEQIDEVVLVGGSTRIPLVRRRWKRCSAPSRTPS